MSSILPPPFLQWRVLPQGWWKWWLTCNRNIDYQWPVFFRTSYPYCIPVVRKEKIPAEIMPPLAPFVAGPASSGFGWLPGPRSLSRLAGAFNPADSALGKYSPSCGPSCCQRFYKMDSGFVWKGFFKQQQQQIFSVWFCEIFSSSSGQPSTSRRASHTHNGISQLCRLFPSP